MSDETTFGERTAIRRWTANAITVILQNDERWHPHLTMAACDAVTSFAPGETPSDAKSYFNDALRGRGASGYTLDDYALAVGRAVCEAIGDLLDEYEVELPRGTDDIPLLMLRDLLDLGDSAQAQLFGEDWMPEADDVEWDDDDEEEEDDDEPTWPAQLEAARKLDDDELQRHASVSVNNRHQCEECFCCAAFAVLGERGGYTHNG